MTLTNFSNILAIPKCAKDKLQGVCKVHGDFEIDAIYFGGKLMNAEVPCPDCMLDKHKADEIERTAQEVNERKHRMLVASGVPLRMCKSKISEYKAVNKKAQAHKETCQKFADEWPQVHEKGNNLIMCGKPGNGKTHLACGIIRDVIGNHLGRSLYTTASDMLRHVRGSYNKGAEYTERDAFNGFSEVPLLVLDEVGVKLASDHDRATLFEIIDRRYQEMLPTIVISNLGISELESATDERMIDRLSQDGTVMVFDWDSYRSNA